MIRILLIRHGLAGKADPEAWPDDDLRPLTDKGRKTFKQAAKGLRTQGLQPARILTSPALRTSETAALLAKGLRLPPQSIRTLPELHHRVSPAKALDRLSQMRLPRCLALVGHEPWLGGFLSLLTAGGEHRARAEFAKGGACLVEAEAWHRGKGTLCWLLTQDQLAALA